ncbi:MAG: hypothetical protein GEU75_16035 [Dehalococcoidia bacterium]|nr:hypothetical protein [Dehalococcoidia bacterium]
MTHRSIPRAEPRGIGRLSTGRTRQERVEIGPEGCRSSRVRECRWTGGRARGRRRRGRRPGCRGARRAGRSRRRGWRGRR